MVEDIRRTPPYNRTEVLALAALSEQGKKSPSTCNARMEQLPAQEPPHTPPARRAVKTKPIFPYRLYCNHGHAGRYFAQKMHSNNSHGHCTNCQGTQNYCIVCIEQHEPQPPNDLNAILCDFCYCHQHGRKCNENQESCSVQYSTRTKKAIRTPTTYLLYLKVATNQTLILRNVCILPRP